MVHPDQMIRPYPALPRAVPEARPGGRFGRAGPQAVQQEGHHRPAMLVEPGLDPSAGLRAATRSWPSSATRAAAGPRRRSSGCWTSRWSCCGEVVPLHRELLERGPGGADDHALLSSDPAAAVGQAAGAAGDARRDAAASISKATPRTPASTSAAAVEFHEKLFGQKPRGHVALGRLGLPGRSSRPSPRPASSGSPPTRKSSPARPTAGSRATATATSAIPEMLYRPWRVEEQGKPLQIVFRDHAMSDQIGFHYQRYAPEHAVDDFVGKLEAIGNATGGNAGHRPTLVSIILDGENCWEYYPNGGVEFLRGAVSPRGAASARSSRCASATTWPSYPATDKLGHLFPGSWIQHNFGIWIGHPECNRAWDLLHETRQYLVARAGAEVEAGRADRPGLGRTVHRRGERLVLVVRRQPQQRPGRAVRPAVPQAPAERLPGAGRAAADASWPGRSARASATPQVYTEPTGLLSVKVDGRRTLLRVDQRRATTSCGGSRGTMSMVTRGLHLRPVLRLRHRAAAAAAATRAAGPFREQLADVEALRIVFLQPEGFELLVVASQPAGAGGAAVAPRRAGDGRVARRGGGRRDLRSWPFPSAAWPSQDRRAGPLLRRAAARTSSRWSACRTKGRSKPRVPSPDYELIMWQA